MNEITFWLPFIAALVGGGGVGTLVTALVSARGSVYKNMNDLVDQLQEDRVADRETVSALTTRVNLVLTELYIEREYSSSLYHWGLAGAPPPPPARNTVL